MTLSTLICVCFPSTECNSHAPRFGFFPLRKMIQPVEQVLPLRPFIHPGAITKALDSTNWSLFYSRPFSTAFMCLLIPLPFSLSLFLLKFPDSAPTPFFTQSPLPKRKLSCLPHFPASPSHSHSFAQILTGRPVQKGLERFSTVL